MVREGWSCEPLTCQGAMPGLEKASGVQAARGPCLPKSSWQ